MKATCSIDDCDRPHHARGWCATHYTRWTRTGDPATTLPPSGGGSSPGPDSARWTGDAASYNAVHFRLKRLRGRAADYACQHCPRQAHHWAYDHLDPNEKTDSLWGCPYSADLDHYFPLCGSCHQLFDSLMKVS